MYCLLLWGVCCCYYIVCYCYIVSENFLPNRVSSLILDLERDVVLPSTSSFLRVGLGLGLDVQVILVVGLHGLKSVCSYSSQ